MSDHANVRIPITMCHGINLSKEKPLTRERLASLIKVAAERDFTSIDYHQLAAWRSGEGTLPDRPIMFDFDHPVKSMRYEVHDILSEHGFAGNLFVNTAPMEPGYTGWMGGPDVCMTWDEIGELVEAGWHIGAHTVTHPNLSELSLSDPSGDIIRQELADCDATIEKHLGIRCQDFAFTGTSFSNMALDEVKKRYRFGRLWITQTHYQVDGERIRYADLVGVDGADEDDGGPPMAARYIYRDTDPYLLPSMEFQALIYEPDAFARYLDGALFRCQ